MDASFDLLENYSNANLNVIIYLKLSDVKVKIIYIILAVIAIGLAWLSLELLPSMKSFIKLRVIEENDNITYYLGNGGNSGLIIGNEAAILVDTKFGNFSKKLHKRIQAKIGAKDLFIINTHYHQDHIGGNELYKDAEILAGNYGEVFWLEVNEKSSLPTIWIDEIMSIDLGGKKVELIPVGANHTKNDVFIYLPTEKILFTGDVYSHNTHPVIREDSAPNISNWESTLAKFASSDRVIDKVVPGHGDLGTKSDLSLAANYFSDLRQLSKKAVKKKYRKWYRLPFMATSGRNWKYVQDQQGKANAL